MARSLGVRPWLGEEASKARVMSGRAPRVLHLSTHAFFLPERPTPRRPSAATVAVPILPEPTGPAVEQAPGGPPAWENPLHRSGLALAGDATLTAYDITTMDLLGTELVMLPMCETPVQQAMAWSRVSGLLSASVQAGRGTWC